MRNEKGLILEEYVNGALDTRYEYDENDNILQIRQGNKSGGTSNMYRYPNNWYKW